MADSFSIYRIVCFSTGKVYVGKALNPKIRKKAHFVALKAGEHHSHYLQNTYNKYGKGAFYFEVIETGINEADIDDRETYWIAHFDSYYNGFNGTTGGSSGTHSKGACIWNGITYDSMAEAARANGVDFTVLLNRIKYGHTCDSDLWKQRKTCSWNGIKYPSIADAARANGTSKGAMARRIKKGFTCDADLNPYYAGKPCTWNGVTYLSICAAATAIGINHDAMHKRLQSGYTCDADLKCWHGEGKTCTWNGITYPSMSAAAQAHNITFTAMWNRIKKGYTCDSDMPGRWAK